MYHVCFRLALLFLSFSAKPELLTWTLTWNIHPSYVLDTKDAFVGEELTFLAALGLVNKVNIVVYSELIQQSQGTYFRRICESNHHCGHDIFP
ncbi:hypothetical protein C8Q78DRAFT_1055830 [Trametes maxima]|nr:hypothetical protein C8Q78DRAFT_1055830 [Trametes maxima]